MFLYRDVGIFKLKTPLCQVQDGATWGFWTTNTPASFPDFEDFDTMYRADGLTSLERGGGGDFVFGRLSEPTSFHIISVLIGSVPEVCASVIAIHCLQLFWILINQRYSVIPSVSYITFINSETIL